MVFKLNYQDTVYGQLPLYLKAIQLDWGGVHRISQNGNIRTQRWTLTRPHKPICSVSVSDRKIHFARSII